MDYMKIYVEHLAKFGEVRIDFSELNDFFDYVYSCENLPFDPDDLRRDAGDNLIYLA